MPQPWNNGYNLDDCPPKASEFGEVAERLSGLPHKNNSSSTGLTKSL